MRHLVKKLEPPHETQCQHGGIDVRANTLARYPTPFLFLDA